MKDLNKKKICIIGGGPSGLSSLRRILESSKLTGTLFEIKDDVGGVWNYNGSKLLSESSANSVSSMELSDGKAECVNTMYDNLRANLPYVVMALEDFPHKKGQETFPTQKEMHDYFRNYATHFNLWPHIKVNTPVISVRPENPSATDGDLNQRWIVKSRDQTHDTVNTEVYDGILICTGSNTHPYEPKLSGQEKFQGKVFHAKYFKNANSKEFVDKDVVLVGLGPSSGDLGTFLSKTAKSVTVCHKFPMGFKLGFQLPNVRETKRVKEVTSDGVITVEDEYVKCDTIVLCTGYINKYPFLDEECGLVVKENGKYVPDLYEMMIFTKRPSLAILNMIYRAPEISCVEVQVKYYVAYLEGKVQLPSFNQMESELKAEEIEKKEKGIEYSEWYQIGTFGLDFWDYYARLIEKMGIEHEYTHSPLQVHIWRTIVQRLFSKFSCFRKDRIKVVSEKEWEYYMCADPNEIGSTEKKIVMKVDGKENGFSVEIVEL